MLTFFIFSIAAVSASDVNDTVVAGEDTNQMELSPNSDEDNNNLKTSENSPILTYDDNNESVSVGTDLEILSSSEGNYTDLRKDIANGGSLTKSIYRYCEGDGGTIEISSSKVINGNGAVIDMSGSNIRAFYVSSSGVTFKNLTIKNANYNDNGGAIYFYYSGTVTNCNFTNNTAANGGAIYFDDRCIVTNCNFTNNKASNDGGAIYFKYDSTVTNCNFISNTASTGGAAYIFDRITATNCNFTNNTASNGGAAYFSNTGSLSNCNFTNNKGSTDGGALYMYYGTVTNSMFSNNIASRGGAILSHYWETVTADTCIFKKNSDSTYQVHILPPTLNVDNFTTFYGSGEKLTLDLKTNSSIPVTNGNISISIYFKDNDSWIGNYSCLSGEGWTVDFPVGSYYAIFNTEYGKFEPINRTVTITIPKIQYYINVTSVTTNNKTVNITAKSNIPKNILWDGKLLFILPDGTEINATYGANGTWWAEYSFEDYGFYQVTASYVGLDNVTVNNGTLAVTTPEHTFWFLNHIINGNDNLEIELSNDFYFDPEYDSAFVNGIVINRQVIIKGNGSVIDAKGQARIFNVQSENTVIENLTLKNAKYNSDGGAILFYCIGTVSNCNFTDNTANHGGAVYFYSGGNVSNCNFAGNTATNYGGAVYIKGFGSVSNCNFTDNTASQGGAVFFENSIDVRNCNFAGNTATNYGGAVYFLDQGSVTDCNFTNNTVTRNGGAISFIGLGTVKNCNFTDNTASEEGGAVCFTDQGSVTNCNFTGNNATAGSAIYFSSTSATKTVSNSTFLNNRANSEALKVVKNDDNITITFTGKNNLLNAIYSKGEAEVTFNNVTYWGANGITTISTVLSGSNKAAGQNITVGIVVNDEIVLTKVYVTDDNGTIVLNIAVGDNYHISVHHDTDSYYTEANETISNKTKFNVNVTFKTTHNKTVNITAKSNIPNDAVQGKLLFILNTTEITANYAGNGIWWAVHTFDDYKVYQINASYIGLTNVTINNATINITKANSTITQTDIELNYGESIEVAVITEGAIGITAKIGSTEIDVINNYTVSISGLTTGKYNLTIITIPDEDHISVNSTVTITVNPIASVINIEPVEFDYASNGTTTFTVKGGSIALENITIDEYSNAVISLNNNIITVSGLPVGKCTLRVKTTPDENHTSVTNTTTITVKPIASIINIEAMEFDYASNGTTTFTVKGGSIALENITIDEYSNAVISLNNNVITVSGLPAGTYTLRVKTTPDENHTSVTNTTTITVKPIASIINIEAVEFDYASIGTTTFTIKGGIIALADIGVDNYSDADISLNNKNIITVSGLPAGTYTLRVKSTPDENHTSVTNITTITVNQISSNINVTILDVKIDVNPVVNVDIPADATGIVNVVFNNENYNINLTCRETSIDLPVISKAGNYNVTISYAGDNNYLPQSSFVKYFNVYYYNAADLQDEINNAIANNQSIMDLNKDYVFDSNDKVPVLINSTITINGNDHVIDANSNEAVFNITADDVVIRNITIINTKGTALNVNADSVVISDVTFNNTVDDILVNGNNSTIQNITANNGKGTVVDLTGDNSTIKSIIVSNHTGDGVKVNGSGNKISDIEGTVVCPILKIDCNVTGFNVQINIETTATGYLYFTFNGIEYKNDVINGTSLFNLLDVVPGNYSLNINFEGTGIWGNTTEILQISVNKQQATVTAQDNHYSIVYGGEYSVKTNAAGQNVIFTINDKSYSAVSDNNGVATLELTKNILQSTGVKVISISISGSHYYSVPVNAKITVNKETSKITVKSVKKTYKQTQTKKIKITLKDSKNKSLGKVKITLKTNKNLKGKVGKKLKKGYVFTVNFNKNGVGYIKLTAKQASGFKKGTYKFTVTYKGSTIYKTATKNIKMKIK